MKIILTLLLSCMFSSTFCQTLFNKEGVGVAFIEQGAIYSLKGYPFAYISLQNVYTFNGKHIGFYIDEIWYNSKGEIQYFEKGSVSIATEPEVVRSSKYPLPAKGGKEAAPPRPPLLKSFANYNNVFRIPSNSNSTNNFQSPQEQPYQGNSSVGLGSNSSIPVTNSGDLNLINETGSNIQKSNSSLMQYKLALFNQAKPYIDAAYNFYSRKDLENAELNAKEAISILGNYAHGTNYLLGLISIDKKDWNIAIEYFNLAIKQYKKEGDYYAKRGYCFYQISQIKSAKKDFVKGKRKGSKLAEEYLSSIK